MQTFLPYPDFRESVRVLDWKRLNKQRLEAKQILRSLFGVKKGWRHHTATRMWEGHTYYLCLYGIIACGEWLQRGFNDDVNLLSQFSEALPYCYGSKPQWLGDPSFHTSHQSNLIRKNPEFYGPRFPGVPGDLPYVWPRGTGEDDSRRNSLNWRICKLFEVPQGG